MLKRLQKTYDGQAVRFLLVPCNQFGAQEPKSNAEVKQFAEQYVDLSAGSNVVMLAKSNLNGLACTATGSDICHASSAQCCPANDKIYDYLLENTPPGTIKWNFDKIVVDSTGRPFPGETILHGGDMDEKLAIYFERTARRSIADAVVQEQPRVISSFVGLISLIGFLLAIGLGLERQRKKREEEFANTYFLLA